MGTPALAIQVIDATKKIRSKIVEKHIDQQLQIARQTESFKATVSHELRTPLGSSLFFIQQIIKMLQNDYANSDQP